MAVSSLYALFSGLWGVVVSDLLQFGIAMVGSVVLAVYAVGAAGGTHEMLQQVGQLRPSGLATAMVPDLSHPWELPAITFFIYVGLLWYTDKTADSGGYIAQRLLAAKNEREGTLAMLWFVIAHYVLRAWPWVLTGLASLVLLPKINDLDAYPALIMQVLPVGLRGLLVASLVAAFISTVNTQLNWGASYLTRDVYIRLFRPVAQPRELVWVGRVITVVLVGLAAMVSYYIDSVWETWKLLSLLGAGSGLVLVGRWLWWRINAWSELAVLAAGLTGSLLVRVGLPALARLDGWGWVTGGQKGLPYAFQLVIVISLSTAAWLIATFCTAPAPREKLRDFYRRTRPPGPGWRRVAAECGLTPPRGALRAIALAWALGVTFVFAFLAAVGDLLLERPGRGLILLAVGTAAIVGFYYANRRVGRVWPSPQATSHT
jgi:Na+/proline symporter